tara:strand:+ start:1181 stop:1933 length:753 start_codon:yes stop_codon:yes gene_type:complete
MKILAKNIQKIVFIFLFCTLNAQAFFPGEKYEYDVYYKFIRIGHAYMETSKEIDIIEGQESYHVTYKFRTTDVGDRIYKVRDQLELWINKDTLQLIRQKKTLRERKWKHDSVITMKDNLAMIHGIKEEKKYYKEREAPDFFYNPYSMILILRNFEIEEGDFMKFVTFEKKVKVIDITNIGYKKIKTPLGKFDAYTYKPFYKGSAALKNSGDLELSYALVGNVIAPVKIAIKLNKGYGTIDLRLQSYSGEI